MNVAYAKRISKTVTPAQAKFAKWEERVVKNFISVK